MNGQRGAPPWSVQYWYRYASLDAFDGFDDLAVRELRLLHAVELLNEKILIPDAPLLRGITGGSRLAERWSA